MLAGQAELRKEMRAGHAELRKEMRAGQAELWAGQAELRKEMQAGQSELRKEMRAGQAELWAGQAELRAGQIQLREDLAALGVRLAVVEHRTDTLESRFAATEQHSTEPCEVVDCPGS